MVFIFVVDVVIFVKRLRFYNKKFYAIFIPRAWKNTFFLLVFTIFCCLLFFFFLFHRAKLIFLLRFVLSIRDFNNNKNEKICLTNKLLYGSYITVCHTEQPFNRHLIVMIVVAGDISKRKINIFRADNK